MVNTSLVILELERGLYIICMELKSIFNDQNCFTRAANIDTVSVNPTFFFNDIPKTQNIT